VLTPKDAAEKKKFGKFRKTWEEFLVGAFSALFSVRFDGQDTSTVGLRMLVVRFFGFYAIDQHLNGGNWNNVPSPVEPAIASLSRF